MYPVLFEIPVLGFPLRSFGVLVAAGFLVGIWLWARLLARYGRDPEEDPARSSQVAMWLLIGILGGARLFYVGVEVTRYVAAEKTPPMEAYLGGSTGAAAQLSPEELELARRISVGHDFVDDPLSVLFLWEGGLVMYGGLVGAVLLGVWSARKQGLHPWNALDAGLVAGFLGQAIGRWGCLLVGDDYGSVVPEEHASLPFPITVRVPDRTWLEANPESLFDASLAGQTLWATQVWMSLNALVIAAVGWWWLRRRRRDGFVAAWIVLHYSVTRFLIESFRGDEVRGLWFGGAISTSQLIAIPGALLGVWFLVRLRGPREPEPGELPATA